MISLARSGSAECRSCVVEAHEVADVVQQRRHAEDQPRPRRDRWVSSRSASKSCSARRCTCRRVRPRRSGTCGRAPAAADSICRDAAPRPAALQAQLGVEQQAVEHRGARHGDARRRGEARRRPSAPRAPSGPPRRSGSRARSGPPARRPAARSSAACRRSSSCGRELQPGLGGSRPRRVASRSW